MIRNSMSSNFVLCSKPKLNRKLIDKIPECLTGKIFNITGHLRKKTTPPKTKEEKKFHNIKLKQMPNSKRVLFPHQFLTETNNHKRTKSKANIDSKEFNYISNVDYIIKRRKNNISKDFLDNRLICNIKTDNKRSNKNTPFTTYSTTTQIFNLPGGIKRKENDVEDDKNLITSNNNKIRNRVSYKSKIKNDYNTNIVCLPGCPLNTENNENYKNKIIIRNIVKMNESDIFNLRNQPLNKEEGKYKISKKKIFADKNNITSPQSSFSRIRNNIK